MTTQGGHPYAGKELNQLQLALAETPIRQVDWSETLAMAPRAIGVLGECLLLTSHRRAALVELPGLATTSLPVNLRQLAITGEVAFHDAASAMHSISMQASVVAKEHSGLIDRIIKYALKNQTPAVARELARNRASLEKVIKTCIDTAEGLQTTFRNWHNETVSLYNALGIRHTQSEKDANKVARDLSQTESDVEKIRTQLGFDRISLREIEQQLYERKEASDATDVAGSDLAYSGLALCLLGATALGGGIIVGAALSIFGRKILVANAQAKREEELRQLKAKTLEKQNLESMLNKLQTESSTTLEVKNLLSSAIEQLSELQSEILTLLQFFHGVFDHVRLLGEDEANPGSARVLLQRTDEEGIKGFREDDDIKSDLLKDAFTLRVSFTLIGRVANMYSELSQRYFLPEMREVQKIGLPGDSQTPAQIKAKQISLQAIRDGSEQGVRKIIKEKEEQLNKDMEHLIRQGLISLRTVIAQ